MAQTRFAEAVERIAAGAPSERAERELAIAQQALGIVEAFAAKEAAPAPDVHVYVPEREVTVEAPDVHVSIEAPEVAVPKIDVHVPAQAPPTVEVAAAPAPEVTVNVEAPKPRSVRVEEDDEGNRRYVQE